MQTGACVPAVPTSQSRPKRANGMPSRGTTRQQPLPGLRASRRQIAENTRRFRTGQAGNIGGNLVEVQYSQRRCNRGRHNIRLPAELFDPLE